MKNWLFLGFGVLLWVCGAATYLETLKFAAAVDVDDRSFAYDYPTAPPFPARCLHPPGTASVWEIGQYAIEITMYKRKEECAVVGCRHQHKTLYRLPAAEDKRAAWIEFIFFRAISQLKLAKNCWCVRTTLTLTVSPILASTRQEYSADFYSKEYLQTKDM